MTELEGKHIKQILLHNTHEIVKFIIKDKDPVVYKTHDDCCSETWVEEFFNIGALLDATVNRVEEIPLGKKKTCLYGYRIYTDKGTSTIVFRNSSNGYYGGSIVILEYGLPLDGWIDLKEDIELPTECPYDPYEEKD